jgi:hypothetical protein
MKNPIRNLVALAAPAPGDTAAAHAAVLDLARAKDPEGASVDSSGRVIFTIEWEPAFKDIKELSAKFPQVTFTLYGDAFAKSHWLSKTVYSAGKAGEDATLSRIDGASFRSVYSEVFGEAFPAKG